MNLRAITNNNKKIQYHKLTCEEMLTSMANKHDKFNDVKQFISVQPTYFDEPEKAFICGSYDTKLDEDGEFESYKYGKTITEAITKYYNEWIIDENKQSDEEDI